MPGARLFQNMLRKVIQCVGEVNDEIDIVAQVAGKENDLENFAVGEVKDEIDAIYETREVPAEV